MGSCYQQIRNFQLGSKKKWSKEDYADYCKIKQKSQIAVFNGWMEWCVNCISIKIFLKRHLSTLNVRILMGLIQVSVGLYTVWMEATGSSHLPDCSSSQASCILWLLGSSLHQPHHYILVKSQLWSSAFFLWGNFGLIGVQVDDSGCLSHVRIFTFTIYTVGGSMELDITGFSWEMGSNVSRWWRWRWRWGWRWWTLKCRVQCLNSASLRKHTAPFAVGKFASQAVLSICDFSHKRYV